MPTPPHLHMTADLPAPKVTPLTVEDGWTVRRSCQIIEFNGLVFLQGYVVKAASATPKVFTIPEKYRPDRVLLMHGYNSGKSEPANIEISPDGDVVVWDARYSQDNLSSVSFDSCFWILSTS